MEVSPATATPATTGPVAVASGDGGGKTVINSDFTTFLKMLTTQMQNQDPLNPMESSDFAVQLATFSGVEQQMKTNELLGTLGGQMGVMGMAQLAGWVGMEARAAAPAWFDGSPVTLSPNPAALADKAVLVVKNSSGKVVSREEVPVSAEPMEWVGVDANGNPLPDGVYSFELESYAEEKLIGTGPVDVYATIIEARGGAGSTWLVLEGGVKVESTSVTALRQP